MGDSFPAVAGLQLLSLAATFSGQGPTAKKLLFDGIDMAKRLDLLSSGDKTPKSARVYSTDELKAASSAAWGLFCHTTYVYLDRPVTPNKVLTWDAACMLCTAKSVSCGQLARPPYQSQHPTTRRHSIISASSGPSFTIYCANTSRQNASQSQPVMTFNSPRRRSTDSSIGEAACRSPLQGEIRPHTKVLYCSKDDVFRALCH